MHQGCRSMDKLGLTIGKNTGTDSTPIETCNDPDGKYNVHYKREMVKAHITTDYDHNIPLAKKVCGGTENDDKYLEGMLRKTAESLKRICKRHGLMVSITAIKTLHWLTSNSV